MTQEHTRAENVLTSFVTAKLARTQNKLNAQATHLLKQGCDLTLAEWRIILILRIFDGAPMSKLAAEVQMDKGQLSRKISAMTQKGLIVSAPDARDNRMQHLHLTRSATDIADRMTPVMQRRQALLVADVAPDDLDTFFAVLAKIDAASEARDFDTIGEHA
jgi:DNA-binding MarR family transcriptional regulator